MTVLISLLGCLGEAALIYVMIIFLRLSKKLGEVTKMPPLYRGFYLAIFFLFVSAVTRFLSASLVSTPPEDLPAWFLSPWFYLILHDGMLSLGLSVALPLVWRYWGWLVRE